MQGDALQLKYLSIIKCETVLVPRPALTSPASDRISMDQCATGTVPRNANMRNEHVLLTSQLATSGVGFIPTTPYT